MKIIIIIITKAEILPELIATFLVALSNRKQDLREIYTYIVINIIPNS